MKKLILNSFLFIFLMYEVNANYYQDYKAAHTELNQKLISNENAIEPKKQIQTVQDFFYNLILCNYAKNSKKIILKNKALKCLKQIKKTSLIFEILSAVKAVYGDHENPTHLSLYAIRGYKYEITTLLGLFKSIQADSQYKEIKHIYENYKQDLLADLIF